MHKNKKIFFWAPMLGNVGTIKATINSIESILEETDYKVYILNVFGEFSFYEKNNINLKKLNIFRFLKFFPKTGILSKFCIYFFSFLSFPFLFYYLFKYRPNILHASLVGYIPLISKIFFRNLKVFNSIQGYPRFNLLRKLIWKTLYTKSDLIITMTENTKKKLIQSLGDIKHIKTILNPVIDNKIYIKSEKKIDKKFEMIFYNKISFISIGRLTRQKNYIELLKAFEIFQKKFDINFVKENLTLVIIGEGEDLFKLKKFVKDQNILNVYFLGFQDNPFNLLKYSNFYVSSSLWEDPGHTLIEAAALKIPIITSDCPSGPKEFFNMNNSFVYRSGNYKQLSEILLKITNNINNKDLNINQKIISSFELSKKFTKKKFYEGLRNYL